MKGEWITTNLFDLAADQPKSFVDGDWIESPYIETEGIRLIQTGNIGIGYFKNSSKKYISEKTFKQLGCTEVYEGDLLICRLADPIGRACIVPNNGGRYITSVDVCILRVGNKASKEYLHHYFNTKEFLAKAETLSAGSTRQRISRINLGHIEFSIPPLPQQRKIAHILSTCDAVIEKTEAAIAKYAALKQGLMHDLFTRGIDNGTGKLRPPREEAPELYKKTELGWVPKEWEVKRLEEIGNVISGGTPSSHVSEFWNGDILWITPTDLSKNESTTIDDSMRKISRSGLDNSGALLISENSLVISSRAPIGYCAIVKREFTTNQGCKSVSFFNQNHAFFYYYNIRHHINRIKAKGEGTTFSEISKKGLESVLLSNCSKEEQIQISERLVRIDDIISIEQSTLSKYRELKAGLMQDLLTGKVEVEVEKETVKN